MQRFSAEGGRQATRISGACGRGIGLGIVREFDFWMNWLKRAPEQRRVEQTVEVT
jgi:hypothetical protein